MGSRGELNFLPYLLKGPAVDAVNLALVECTEAMIRARKYKEQLDKATETYSVMKEAVQAAKAAKDHALNRAHDKLEVWGG
jgi:hypothetical protein